MTTAEHDDAVAFGALVGQLNFPMFIVTTGADGARSGCLAGFASRVSIRHHRLLVGLSNKNDTHRLAVHAGHLPVPVLPERDRDLAHLCGEQTGATSNKLAQCRRHPGPAGLPILDDAAAWFGGRISERLPLGDHVAFLLEPDARCTPEGIGAVAAFSEVSDLDAGAAA